MSDNQSVRQSVADAYRKAVEQPAKTCSCCGGETTTKGAVAKLAGYGHEELSSLPRDAVTNSFGCGNPLAFSDIKAGDVVLDLGSGAGIDILLAGKLVGPAGYVIGIDMTDEMIARAEENIKAAGLENVEVRKGIIEELPVEDESVDWVISNCVINLSPEKENVFSEIARVLKPGGRMQVSDLVAVDLPDWVRENESLHNSCIAGTISEDEYLDGLRKAGLTDTRILERLTYELSQLKEFVESETSLLLNDSCCQDVGQGKTLIEIAESLAGKIWSAKIYARKPG